MDQLSNSFHGDYKRWLNGMWWAWLKNHKIKNNEKEDSNNDKVCFMGCIKLQ